MRVVAVAAMLSAWTMPPGVWYTSSQSKWGAGWHAPGGWQDRWDCGGSPGWIKREKETRAYEEGRGASVGEWPLMHPTPAAQVESAQEAVTWDPRE